MSLLKSIKILLILTMECAKDAIESWESICVVIGLIWRPIVLPNEFINALQFFVVEIRDKVWKFPVVPENFPYISIDLNILISFCNRCEKTFSSFPNVDGEAGCPWVLARIGLFFHCFARANNCFCKCCKFFMYMVFASLKISA